MSTTTCAPKKNKQTVQVCLKRTGKPSAPLNGPEAVCAYLRPLMKGADRESFHVLHLDSPGRVIGHEEAHRGTVSGVEVHPRETFKGAILNNASAVILAHNHPSGKAEPSQQDKELTQRLAEVGNLVGIPVRDHVIVTDDACYSLRSQGFQARFGRARSAADLGAPDKDGTKTAWWVLGIFGAILGSVVIWKWRQINFSGVPLDFALRRTFSRNFGEGHVGLLTAWRQEQAKALPPG